MIGNNLNFINYYLINFKRKSTTPMTVNPFSSLVSLIGLLITIFILLGLGLMMVLSASAPSALNYEGDSYFYFKNQAKNALVGIVRNDFLFVNRLQNL